MSNRGMFSWLKRMSGNEDFQTCIFLSDKAKKEQYDLELVLRFLLFRRMDEPTLSSIPYPDISDYITRCIIDIPQENSLDFEIEEDAFNVTFGILAAQLQENSFRKYSSQKGRFVGGFLVSMFEAVALGIGYNFEDLRQTPIDVFERIQNLWNDARFTSSLGGSPGGSISTRKRVQNILPVGREVFQA